MRRSQRPSAAHYRHGAIIVCVLVLLMIVGLLMSQTVQTLLLLRRGATTRHRARQAAELVELGKLICQRAESELPSDDLLISLGDSSNSPTERASMRLTIFDSQDSQPASVHIKVTYPLGESQEFTSTYSFQRSESVDASQP